MHGGSVVFLKLSETWKEVARGPGISSKPLDPKAHSLSSRGGRAKTERSDSSPALVILCIIDALHTPITQRITKTKGYKLSDVYLRNSNTNNNKYVVNFI